MLFPLSLVFLIYCQASLGVVSDKDLDILMEGKLIQDSMLKDEFKEVYDSPLPLFTKRTRSKAMMCGKERKGVGKINTLLDMPCKAYATLVQVPPPTNYDNIHPAYVQLNRCGGNCLNKMYKCTADITDIINVKVTKNPGTDFEQDDCSIPMVNETKCICHCVKSEEDCNPKTQYWEKNQCECICKPGLEDRCRGFPKRWNHSTCTCMCENYQLECKPGQRRDPGNDCQCRPLPILSK